MLVNAQRAARQYHVPLHRSRWYMARKNVSRTDRCRLLCSRSSDEWQAASDAEWGNSAQQDAEPSRKRTLRASLLLAAGLAFAFVLSRIAWTDSQVGRSIHRSAEQATSTSGNKIDSTNTLQQDGKADDQPPAHENAAPASSLDGVAAGSAPTFADSNVDEAQRAGAQHESDVDDAQPNSETTHATNTDHTQEPLLQHLFEDLEQRPADAGLRTATSETSFDHTVSLDLGPDDLPLASEAPGLEASATTTVAQEPADELAVKNSDIDKLESLTGHDQLQQRAALAVRAAQAALCACENASAHSAASCRSAAEAASAANTATRAASQALSAADRSAEEDLERALRRVQHAQQQARDAEAAAATAATSASAKADTATEQARLAQEAATPQEEQVDVKQNVKDKVKTWAIRGRATVMAWVQTFCTWCSQAWQAFLAWTSRVGEHVQRLISRRS